MGHQEDDWLATLRGLRRDEAWRDLKEEGRSFVTNFEEGLRLAHGKAKRAVVVTPFTAALKQLLARRGMVLDARAAFVDIGSIRRRADLSGVVDDQYWVIEVKTGMDFNSLGAALVEGMAFKRYYEPPCRFMLVCLYEKNKRGNLLDVLEVVDPAQPLDQVHLLSSNADTGPGWYRSFVERINKMVRTLPMA